MLLLDVMEMAQCAPVAAEAVETAPAAAAEMITAADDEDDVPCAMCHSTGGAQHMLLCDGPGCTTACHTYCCQPPLTAVPDGEWLCQTCSVRHAAPRPAAPPPVLVPEGAPQARSPGRACVECGATNSAKWRRGGSLCNACGLAEYKGGLPQRGRSPQGQPPHAVVASEGHTDREREPAPGEPPPVHIPPSSPMQRSAPSLLSPATQTAGHAVQRVSWEGATARLIDEVVVGKCRPLLLEATAGRLNLGAIASHCALTTGRPDGAASEVMSACPAELARLLREALPPPVSWRTAGDLLRNLPPPADIEPLVAFAMSARADAVDGEECCTLRMAFHAGLAPPVAATAADAPRSPGAGAEATDADAIEWLVVEAGLCGSDAARAVLDRGAPTQTALRGVHRLQQRPGELLILPPGAACRRVAGKRGALLLRWLRLSLRCAAASLPARQLGRPRWPLHPLHAHSQLNRQRHFAPPARLAVVLSLAAALQPHVAPDECTRAMIKAEGNEISLLTELVAVLLEEESTPEGAPSLPTLFLCAPARP